MRFIPHYKIEQVLVHDRMMAVIVGKFCLRDFIGPGTRVVSTEDLKVCFDLLVDMFSFVV